MPADSPLLEVPGAGEEVDRIIWDWLYELRHDPNRHPIIGELTDRVAGVEPLSLRFREAGLDGWSTATEALSQHATDPGKIGEIQHPANIDLPQRLRDAAVRLAVVADHPDLFVLCEAIWHLTYQPGFDLSRLVADKIGGGPSEPALANRLRAQLKLTLLSQINSRVWRPHRMETRFAWPGSTQAFVGDTWAYRAMARAYPEVLLGLLSDMPPALVHATVEAAISGLTANETGALLAAAPRAFSDEGLLTEDVGVFALLEDMGPVLIGTKGYPSSPLEVPALGEVIDILFARADGQWLARAWLQRLIWQGNGSRFRREDQDPTALWELLRALAQGTQPIQPDPSEWIDVEEPLWRVDRVLTETLVLIEHKKLPETGNVLSQAIKRGSVTSTGRAEGMQSNSIESSIVGNAIAVQLSSHNWFNELWKETYNLRERQRVAAYRSIDNPAYPALAWALSGLNHLDNPERAMPLWRLIRDALIETRLTDINVDLPSNLTSDITLVAARIGGALITRKVMPPSEFEPLLDHMMSPTEEFAQFLSRLLGDGVNLQLIELAQLVGAAKVAAAAARGLEDFKANQLRKPRRALALSSFDSHLEPVAEFVSRLSEVS